MEKERKEIGTVSFRNRNDGGDVLRVVLYTITATLSIAGFKFVNTQ